MALRDQLRSNATPYLEPGETIEAVFVAQTATQWLVFLSIWILLLSNGYRAVVVTDRRILVCQAGRFRTTAIKSVLHELPRNTLIGPAHGLWYRTEALGPKPLWVHKRFHKDVAAADERVRPLA